jgi:cobalt-zinc-cadmium efflux system outer membrane protein
MLRQLLLLSGLLLAGGCAWPVRQLTDQVVRDMASHPFDVAPENGKEPANASAEASQKEGTSASSRSERKNSALPEVAADVMTAVWLGSKEARDPREVSPSDAAVKIATAIQSQPGAASPVSPRPMLDLKIPRQIPGSEAPEIRIPKDKADAEKAIKRIYPELPPLPVEPQMAPGPEGRPYTLADLQQMASANSPTLRQAVSDVEAARGNLIQAKTYPNPIVSYLVDPSNNNSTAGVQGGSIEQLIRTGGKQKLGAAAAQKDLDNALLALKRARSDLSTAVRNAYFTLLVDKETLVVTRALARFTDDIYRAQTGLLGGAQVAPYEPSSLRAQAHLARLAYKQAIFSYIYDWKALVATIGLEQLPLTEIAGRVDRLIPYYDYDTVLAHVLRSHTDILTARNAQNRAQYSLKLAQVTPIPDFDVRMTLEKDFALAPFGTYHALSVGLPLPIWDQNKGNIIASQAALVRASEESHRVEVNLTNNLASAYSGYKNNLAALEDYRRTILPDLVRYYRGIYSRRQVDPAAAFNDLVTAQQTLSANVTAYIGVLGSLWTSVVAVADFLQTDDLFQLAEPRSLPEMPDFNQLSLLSCGHPALAASCASLAAVKGSSPGAPAARVLLSPPAVEATTEPSRTGPASLRPLTAGGGPPPASSPDQGAPVKPRIADPEAPPTTTNPFRTRPSAVRDPQGAPNIRPAAPGEVSG